MIDSKIDELLGKLRGLDPETWSRVDKVLGLVVYPRSPLGHYIIQGVIQDAIAAHSGWSIDFDGPHPWAINLWRCQISFGDFRTAWGGTPAEAILAAYVAALEAEREAGR